MKKLIAVAVLAAFSSLPYAAEKDITTDVVVVGQGAAGTAAAFAAAEQGQSKQRSESQAKNAFQLFHGSPSFR